MPHDQVGPADRDAGPPQGRHDLLVDAVGPSDVVAEREQPDVVDHGVAAAAVGAGVAGASHHVAGRLIGPQAVEQRPQCVPLGRVDDVVGIEPEGVIARRVGAARRSAPRRSRRSRRTRTPGRRTPGRSPGSGRLLPVSTTTISSKIPRTDARQCGRFSSSSLTIMVSETLAVRGRRSEGEFGPQMFAEDADQKEPEGRPTEDPGVLWASAREIFLHLRIHRFLIPSASHICGPDSS